MQIDVSKIIKRPLVSEKSSALKNISKIVFEVYPKASKPMIKQAVQKAFKVTVIDVRTMLMPGKTKKSFLGKRRSEVKLSKWKKAIVTLKEGDKIEVVEGV